MLNMYCPATLHSPFSPLFYSFPSWATTLMPSCTHHMPEYKVYLFDYYTSEVPRAPEQRHEHAPLCGSLQPQQLPRTLTPSTAISQGGIPRRGKKQNKNKQTNRWAIFLSAKNTQQRTLTYKHTFPLSRPGPNPKPLSNLLKWCLLSFLQ